jgi:hypothetical protein
MRLYKRTYGLRQICNIAVYIIHSACTIHLLNLPEKDAKRDIIHGVKHLEEVAEDWLCARRTLSIISVLARKWKSELPEEATKVLARTDAKYGFFSTADVPSPKSDSIIQTPPPTASPRLSNPVTPAPDRARSQNPLVRSLYSYALPGTESIPNIDTAVPSGVSSQMNFLQGITTTSSNDNGSMTVLMEPPASSISYAGAYNTSISTSRSEQPYNSTATSQTSSNNAFRTKKVSPTTLFGGVDMLVANQDSWLRDQANLAVGFDNWMGTGSGIDINTDANRSMDTAGNDLTNRAGEEFFVTSPTGNRLVSGYSLDDGWPSYD